MKSQLEGFWQSKDYVDHLLFRKEDSNDEWQPVAITCPELGTKNCLYKIESKYFIVRYPDNRTESFEILDRSGFVLKIKTPLREITYLFKKF